MGIDILIKLFDGLDDGVIDADDIFIQSGWIRFSIQILHVDFISHRLFNSHLGHFLVQKAYLIVIHEDKANFFNYNITLCIKSHDILLILNKLSIKSNNHTEQVSQ